MEGCDPRRVRNPLDSVADDEYRNHPEEEEQVQRHQQQQRRQRQHRANCLIVVVVSGGSSLARNASLCLRSLRNARELSGAEQSRQAKGCANEFLNFLH